jgi:hypothetical protein
MPADGTGAANWENGDFGGSRFYGQLFRQELLALYTIWLCEFCAQWGGARFGSLSFNSMILQPYVVRSLSLRRLKEPNATADRYIDGRGMSFGLEDQKPQLKPPSPAGAFLSGWLKRVAAAIRFKSSCSK